MNERPYRDAERRFWETCGAIPSERWLDLVTPATRVRVLEIGAGEPLFFVHGGPGAATIFAPVAAAMTDFRCLLIDRPGCGLSPAITYSGARLDDLMSEVITSSLDTLRLDRVSLVTSSFGGSCALWFAERHPERIAKIVHLGCPAFLSESKLPFMVRMLATPVAGYALARLPLRRGGVLSFLQAMGEGRALADGRISEAFIQWWMSLARDTETMTNERELIRRGVAWNGTPRLRIADADLSSLPHPAYFYWGETEPFGEPAFGVRLAKSMTAARTDVVPGAGHLPWLRDHADVAARTRDFLR